jgi:hypothetical protein
MGKLHELVAVERDLQEKAYGLIDLLAAEFKRVENYGGETTVLQMKDESRQIENSTAHKELASTVEGDIQAIVTDVVRYYDVFASKEASNQTATADVIVDGTTILENVPGTALLGFETRLHNLRKTLSAAPTLPQNIVWEPLDAGKVGAVKRKDPVVSVRTEKKVQSTIVAPATAQHPAQVQVWNGEEPIGTYTKTQFSGLWDPAKKAATLARLDTLISAVKQARTRANDVEAVNLKVGKKIIDYILGA